MGPGGSALLSFRALGATDQRGRCRPEQFLGLWAIEPARLRALESQAREAMRAGLVRPPSAAWDADEDPPTSKPAARPPFRVLRGVAVIDITGPLTKYDNSFMSLFGGTSMVRAREAVRAATRDAAVRGILLRIDSPGGTVAGTADLAEAVREANQKKPVFAYAEDLCCSAAYWIASQARKVNGNSTASVGSIGTFTSVWDSSGMFEEAGIKVHVVASAPLKGAGTSGAPITDEMLANWQREITELNDVFVAGVAKGRRMPIAKARELADARIHVGTNAQRLGLIDGVASFDATLKELERLTMSTEKDTLDLAAEAEDRAVKAEKALTDVQASLAATQKERDDLKARVDALEGKAAAEKDPLAGLTPEARTRLEEAERKAAEATAKVAKMEDEALTKKFEGQVKGYKALALPISFAASLKEIHAKLPEAGKAVDQVLAAADEQCRTGKLFNENGTHRSEESESGATAEQVVEARAKTLLTEGKAKNLQAARDMAWKEDSGLWKRHMQERRAH